MVCGGDVQLSANFRCLSCCPLQLEIVVLFHGSATLVGRGNFIVEVSKLHSIRHTTVGRIPLDEWSHRRRDLCLTTQQHPQETDIHASGGIRIRNLNKRTAEDPRFRRRGLKLSLASWIFGEVSCSQAMWWLGRLVVTTKTRVRLTYARTSFPLCIETLPCQYHFSVAP